MKQEEFNKLLKRSGLPCEFVLKLNQIIKIAKDHEERLNTLEARNSTLNKNKKQQNIEPKESWTLG